MKWTWKLSFPQLCIVCCLGVISFFMVNASFGKIHERYVRGIIEDRFDRFTADIEVSAREAANQAAVFIRLPEVGRAYALAFTGDIDRPDSPQVQEAREFLRQALAPMLESYNEYAGKRLQLHFHLPNGRSFVRLWRDKQTQVDGQWIDISDDLTPFRPTVLDVNRTGQVAMGVELGSQGIVIRGVIPVKDEQGQTIGSAEVLQDFGPILSTTAESDEIEVLLFVDKKRIHVATVLQDRQKNPLIGDFVQVTPVGQNTLRRFITPDLLARGLEHRLFEIQGSLALATLPLHDYKNQPLGILVYAMNTAAVANLANTARLIVAGMLLGMFFLVLLLNNVITALTRAKLKAETASHAKSDFLSRMSHEMRTPLNAVIGMTAIGLADTEVERKHYCLTRINEAAKHLLGVINDVLDMSKIEADKFELSLSRFSVVAMLQRLADVIQFQADAKQQQFVVEIDSALPPMVMADEQRLAQVVTNLLSNAVKFTPPKGVVSLKAVLVASKDRKATLRVSVTDTGIGMTREQIGRLFKPFEQADGSISRKFGGTGLGLAISKRIAEMMGGSIDVSSTNGQGSTFTFTVTVPVVEGESSPATMDFPEGTYRPEAFAGVFQGKRILLAEDVEINQEITSALLQNTGVKIDFAPEGRTAVGLFSGNSQVYDLILMDIQMPSMDGCEATVHIRASGLPGAETVPIIAMTANVFREDIEHYLAIGMNGHIGKPVTPEALLGTLSRHLGLNRRSGG